MVDNDNGLNIGKNQYDQRQQNIFDDSVVEDVESIQEPYPHNEITDEDNSGEVENPDEHREYDDKDHPHEYNPPRAVVDVDYNGASGEDGTNSFEQQNPLQSTISSSDRDR